MSDALSKNCLDSHAPTNAQRCATSRAEAAIDAELVRRCQDNADEEAFAEIVRRHRSRIFSLALASLHNRADAEEITSDTFARAYRGLKDFRGEASLATWLHHIAVNLARNRYWFLFRRRNLATSLDTPLTADSDATLADVTPSDAPDPVQRFAEGEMAAAIRGCMSRLPENQREILQLRGVLNRSYGEIAESLGINVGTVKSRVARARLMLRRQLDRSWPEIAERWS